MITKRNSILCMLARRCNEPGSVVPFIWLLIALYMRNLDSKERLYECGVWSITAKEDITIFNFVFIKSVMPSLQLVK